MGESTVIMADLIKSCYIAAVCDKCHGCNRPITDKALRALDHSWHVACFVCKVGITTNTIAMCNVSRVLEYFFNSQILFNKIDYFHLLLCCG